jgi:CysZ protein
MPFGVSMFFALRFAGVTLLVNLVALAIFFVPVVGVAAFFGANAYLLSREYFEMAAARFRKMDGAAAMRRDYATRTVLAGCLLAAMMIVPILNLVTPLFGIALMVHLHKRLSQREERPLLR